jgi:hypothetical protein
MFAHVGGFRSLWPAMLFLPWLLIGAAWLVKSLLPAEKQLVQAVRRIPVRTLHAGERDRATRPGAPRP